LQLEYYLVLMKIRFLLLFIVVLTLFNCARRGNPTGGPKDENKPITIKTIPEFKSINFKEKEIKIYFDEYIKLKDLNKYLVVSPPLKYPAEISPLGLPSKRIIIKIKDTLIENTTYSFNFGESIVDNNEGNILTNFKYIFSTGSFIDSLSIKGKVFDAFNKEDSESVSILLYEANSQFNDSTIYKEKPLYIGNTLKGNTWEITNLKAGKYRLVALKEENNDFLFNPKTDKIGFIQEDIILPTEKEFLVKIFNEVVAFKPKKGVEVSKGHLIFGYTGNGDDFNVKVDFKKSKLEQLKHQVFKDEKTDSIHYFFKADVAIDSLPFILSNKEFTKNEIVKLRLSEIDSLRLSSNARGNLNYRDTITIKANNPLAKLDEKLISLIDKDTVKVPFTLKRKAYRELQILFDRKESQQYKLTILPSAISDFFDQENDTLKYSFRTKKKDDYGSVTMEVMGVKSPMIIQLINSKKEVIEQQFIKKDSNVAFNLLSPGGYQIRAIYDENDNAKWDTGNYIMKKQAEKVIYFKGEINVKSNWFVNEKLILE